MDFRSCPACKASVLEDDVDDCPFCGASMSGKPSASAPKKPAPAKSQSTKTSSKTAPAETSGKGTSKTPDRPGGRPSTRPAKDKSSSESESDDPFEVDTSALRRAIKLSPRPTKSRTHEVVCPMCETHGFMPPSEAGKDVHCCNSDCMVPVFKSQPIAVEEEPEEEPQGSRWLMYSGGLVLLIGIGVGVWFFVLAPEKKEVVIDAPEVVPETPIKDLHLTPENQVVTDVEAAPATLEEIRNKSLKNIVDTVRQRERNRSPDYGTQLAAEAFAEAGELTQARDQIRRLQSKASRAPYLQIQPLVEIGWQQLADGKLTEAQQTAATASEKAKRLPSSIRKTQDAASALAALLIATGNTQEAQSLISREQDKGQRGKLSMLWRAALDSHSFQIDQEARRPWHLAVPEPMRMAVVECLVAHGEIEKAEALAATGKDLASQSACRAAWAARVAQLKPDQAVDLVTSALKAADAPPSAQCQAWAAVASMGLSKSLSELTNTALKNARNAAAEINTATSVPLPSMRELHDSEGKPHVGLPDPAPAHAAALAVAGLAIDELDAGQREAAWTSFQQAVKLARGMTPSPAATQELIDDCQHRERSVRAQLNSALRLGNNDQRIRAAFIRYRKQCNKLHAEAEQRLDLQVAILRAAVIEGLWEEPWQYAHEQSQAKDVLEREPYLQTSLPGLILSFSHSNGNTELSKQIRGAYVDQPIEVDPLDSIFARAVSYISREQFSEASDVIENGYRTPQLTAKSPDQLDEIALRSCARCGQKATPKEMIPFIKNLYDVIVQEDAFLLLAGESMQRGTAPELWKVTAASRELAALDYASLYRGFVAGAPQKASVTKPAPDSTASTK